MTAPSGASTRHLVVMGVCGVGKTTVATALAKHLGYEFAEGDGFHPPANVAKMSAGVPLGDADRMPWLEELARWTHERNATDGSTVVTCSALKRRYRDVLRKGVPTTCFVHLIGSRELLLERMKGRAHFMPPELLDSQLADLESPGSDERTIEVDVAGSPDRIVAAVLPQIGAR